MLSCCLGHTSLLLWPVHTFGWLYCVYKYLLVVRILHDLVASLYSEYTRPTIPRTVITFLESFPSGPPPGHIDASGAGFVVASPARPFPLRNGAWRGEDFGVRAAAECYAGTPTRTAVVGDWASARSA